MSDRLLFPWRWLTQTLRAWWFCDRHGFECEPDGWDDDGMSRCERCGCPLRARDA